MSTKIYNGFKFKSKNFFEIFEEVKSFKSKCLPTLEKACFKYVALRSVTMLDRYSYYKEKFEKPPEPIIEAYLELLDRAKKVKQNNQRDPVVDFEFNISIFPFKGEFYGIPFTEQREFLNVLTSSPLYADFAFWDNADALENISAEDWKLRGDIWEEIFKESSIPSELSVTFEVTDPIREIPYPVASKILPLVPPIKLRLRDLVDDLLFQDKVRAKKIELNAGNTIKEYREFQEWTKTPEGIKAKEEWEENIVKHLVLNVTAEDLLGENLK